MQLICISVVCSFTLVSYGSNCQAQTRIQLQLGWVGFSCNLSNHPPTTNIFFFTKNLFGQLRMAQQNFNLTIFWGGGSYILPIGLTLHNFLKRNFFYTNHFYPKFFLTRNFFLPKKFFTQKIFCPKKFLLNKFLTQKFFWTKIFFDPKIFFHEKSFSNQKIWDPKNYLTQKKFWPKKFFWPNIFFNQNFAYPTIFLPIFFKVTIIILHKFFWPKF